MKYIRCISKTGRTLPTHEFLAATMWSDFRHGRNAVHRHHGNAVLSRYPIEHYENRDVSVGGSETRCALLPHYAAHAQPPYPRHVRYLGLWESHRQSAVNHAGGMGECLAGIRTGAGGRGDFLRLLRRPPLNAAGLEEIFTRAHGRPARTFPVSMPPLRLDRIYVSTNAVLPRRCRCGTGDIYRDPAPP